MKLYKSAKDVKEALLDCEEVEINGWTASINDQDEIEIYDPQGNGVATRLSFLDKAVSDFIKHAQMPDKMPKPYQYPATKDPKKVLGPDSSGDNAWADPKVNTSPPMQGKPSSPDLGDDSSGDEPWTDPKVNLRPRPELDQGFELPDTDLGPDSSQNPVAWEDKLTGPSEFRMAKLPGLFNELPQDESEDMITMENDYEAYSSLLSALESQSIPYSGQGSPGYELQSRLTRQEPVPVSLVEDVAEELGRLLDHPEIADDEDANNAHMALTDALGMHKWNKGTAASKKALEFAQDFNVNPPKSDNLDEVFNQGGLDFAQDFNVNPPKSEDLGGVFDQGDQGVQEVFDSLNSDNWSVLEAANIIKRNGASMENLGAMGADFAEQFGNGEPPEFWQNVARLFLESEMGLHGSRKGNELSGDMISKEKNPEEYASLEKALNVGISYYEEDERNYQDIDEASKHLEQLIMSGQDVPFDLIDGILDYWEEQSFPEDPRGGPEFVRYLEEAWTEHLSKKQWNDPFEASRRTIVDTFDKEADTNDSYRNYIEAKNASPSVELLKNIADPERWSADRIIEALNHPVPVRQEEVRDVASTPRKKNRPGKGKAQDGPEAAEGPAIGASTEKDAVRIKENWGDYSRDLEAETGEELYHITRALGQDEDYNWNKYRGMGPMEDVDPAEIVGEDDLLAEPAPPVPPAAPTTAKRASVEEVVASIILRGLSQYESWMRTETWDHFSRDFKDYVDAWIQTITEAVTYGQESGSGDVSQMDYPAYKAQIAGILFYVAPEGVSKQDIMYELDDLESSAIEPAFEEASQGGRGNEFGSGLDGPGSGFEASKKAVDESAKNYWEKYFGEYGKKMVTEDSGRPVGKDPNDVDVQERPKTQGQQNVKAQMAAPEALPSAPAGASPADSPAPAAPQAAPPPAAPGAPQKAPGAGDEGLKALGWTPEDIQAMSPQDKENVLKIQLKKPGAAPGAPTPAPGAPKAPSPLAPKNPMEAPQSGPAPIPVQPKTAPGGAPTATRKSREKADAVKVSKAFKMLVAQAPVEQPGAAPPPAPNNPMGQPVQAPPAQQTPATQAVSPEFGQPGTEDVSIESAAFDIYRQIQEEDVLASSPNEVPVIKAQKLVQRLLVEVGMPVHEARSLFGLAKDQSFVKLFA